MDNFKKNPSSSGAVSLITSAPKLDLAFEVYNTLVTKHVDLITGNVVFALASACIKSGQPKRALSLLDDLRRLNVQPQFGCIRLWIKACFATRDAVFANRILDLIKQPNNNVPLNVKDFSQLIQCLSHEVHICLDILRLMTSRGVEPDVTTYILLAKACKQATDLSAGITVHNHIRKSNIAMTPLLETALLAMYSKCGAVDEALLLFDNMRKQNRPLDVLAWTTIIAAVSKTVQL
jgi:pentatricopeptide repeat protein